MFNFFKSKKGAPDISETLKAIALGIEDIKALSEDVRNYRFEMSVERMKLVAALQMPDTAINKEEKARRLAEYQLKLQRKLDLVMPGSIEEIFVGDTDLAVLTDMRGAARLSPDSEIRLEFSADFPGAYTSLLQLFVERDVAISHWKAEVSVLKKQYNSSASLIGSVTEITPDALDQYSDLADEQKFGTISQQIKATDVALCATMRSCVEKVNALTPYNEAKEDSLNKIQEEIEAHVREFNSLLAEIIAKLTLLEAVVDKENAQEREKYESISAECDALAAHLSQLSNLNHQCDFTARLLDVKLPEGMAQVLLEFERKDIAARGEHEFPDDDAEAINPNDFRRNYKTYFSYLKNLLIPNGFDLAGVLRTVAFIVTLPIALLATGISYNLNAIRRRNIEAEHADASAEAVAAHHGLEGVGNEDAVSHLSFSSNHFDEPGVDQAAAEIQVPAAGSDSPAVPAASPSKPRSTRVQF